VSVVDDLFSVRGQVALVTGGASGLGYAFSSILADAGAHVVIADLDADGMKSAVAALSAGGATVSGIQLDVSDAAAVRSAVDGIAAEHGRLDIAFANAGIGRGSSPKVPAGTLDEMSMTDYNLLIDINLHGVVYTAQAAARHMKRQHSGSIVTTASTAGLRNDPFTAYSYTIAKAAVINFTRQAAHDLHDRRRVRAVRREQLVVGAVLDDHPAVQHLAGCGPRAPRWSAGARRRASCGSGSLVHRLDRGLAGQVERGGRLVEQQDVRVHEVGPGQREQLALAGRQAPAALADLVQVAAGEPGDHLVRADGPGRRLDLASEESGRP
jgi:NAD(P)-dependent dehydrogenase (short-subunit alcohol dehydrogenase family)